MTEDNEFTEFTLANGLTKREYFAISALQGLLADPNCSGPEKVAKWAVEYADALINQLNQ